MLANLPFLQPAAHRPQLPQAEVQRRFPWLRWQMLEATFIGYSLFYLVRNNLAPVQADFGAALGYSKSELADFAAITAITYGVGKFFMGAWSDRSNPRTFMALGLALTAFCNFAFSAAHDYWLHLTLWGMNGLFQGMGWPPCGRTLGHWFSENERGLKFSIWNTAHNVGGASIGALAALLTKVIGWQAAFYIPGAIALAGALYLLARLRDTPQSLGLPSIEEFRNDYPPAGRETHEKELNIRELIIDNVLTNRIIWTFALANFFVYIARYAMIDWGPHFLKEARGVDIVAAGFSTSVLETAAIPTTILVGWYSDRLKGRRGLVSLLCMVIVTGAFAVLVYAPHSELWVVYAAFAVIGCFVYPAVALIGIAALDFSSKKAVGAAAGFIGLAGYSGRAAMAKISGVLAEQSWDQMLYFILGCSLLSVFLLIFTVKLRPRG
ncbi:MAG: MFS transporter [Leptospirales bacterium]|nr:MFS transporter [Leptospirales bacterium]